MPNIGSLPSNTVPPLYEVVPSATESQRPDSFTGGVTGARNTGDMPAVIEQLTSAARQSGNWTQGLHQAVLHLAVLTDVLEGIGSPEHREVLLRQPAERLTPERAQLLLGLIEAGNLSHAQAMVDQLEGAELSGLDVRDTRTVLMTYLHDFDRMDNVTSGGMDKVLACYLRMLQAVHATSPALNLDSVFASHESKREVFANGVKKNFAGAYVDRFRKKDPVQSLLKLVEGNRAPESIAVFKQLLLSLVESGGEKAEWANSVLDDLQSKLTLHKVSLQNVASAPKNFSEVRNFLLQMPKVLNDVAVTLAEVDKKAKEVSERMIGEASAAEARQEAARNNSRSEDLPWGSMLMDAWGSDPQGFTAEREDGSGPAELPEFDSDDNVGLRGSDDYAGPVGEASEMGANAYVNRQEQQAQAKADPKPQPKERVVSQPIVFAQP